MSDRERELREKRLREQRDEEDIEFIFKLFWFVIAFVLITVFAWIRYGDRIKSHINHTIDHALDIDIICSDCLNKSDMCDKYWKAEHKCEM